MASVQKLVERLEAKGCVRRDRSEVAANAGSTVEVMTPDRAGLLARIGRVFFQFGLKVQNARITTLGERVEDVFFITDSQHRPLDDTALSEALQRAICEALDGEDGAIH